MNFYYLINKVSRKTASSFSLWTVPDRITLSQVQKGSTNKTPQPSISSQSVKMWSVVLTAATLLAVASADGCVKRNSQHSGENDGHYCVCNATYCDGMPMIAKPLQPGVYNVITSSKSGLRFHLSQGEFGRCVSRNESAGSVVVHPSDRRQTMIGFGGAVTDSAGVNIKSLSPQAADNLMRSYFGVEGLEYNMIRTPMGGSDFSERPYSYAMTENDTLLRHFELQPEDHMYKIPVIKRAAELSRRGLKLLTSPWSASPWMKTNDTWSNNGRLRREYWQLWADYFVRYFQEYKRQGLDFWALSPQNEPQINIYNSDVLINGMAWTAEEQRDWVIGHLAPTLRNAGFQDIKILAGDDNRPTLPDLPKTMMASETGRAIIAGTAVHWYYDTQISPSVLDEVNKLFPEKLLLQTEACTGVASKNTVILGSWQRGEAYAVDIIENTSHNVQAWIDWNLALDEHGGPNWIDNPVDSPIIVNADEDEFYKQPMYYVMGHFSKYVPPGSVRVRTSSKGAPGVHHVCFLTPDYSTVMVLLNTNDDQTQISIEHPEKSEASLTLPGKSISTVQFW